MGETCALNANASTLQWHAEENRTYFVLVFGAPNDFGNFGLHIEEKEVPQNGICLQAQELSPCGVLEITASMSEASYDYFAPKCHPENGYAAPRGLWYLIEGTVL